MIKNRQVYGGPELEITKDLSFGKYVVDKLKENITKSDNIGLINAKTQEQSSHGQLLLKIARIGNGLKLMRIVPGDVVAVCSENCSEHIAATVAASTVGATLSLLNVKYTKVCTASHKIYFKSFNANLNAMDIKFKLELKIDENWDILTITTTNLSDTDEMVHALNISKPKLIFCSQSALEAKLSLLLQFSCIEHIIQLTGAVTTSDVKSLAAVEVADTDIEGYKATKVGADDTAFIFYSSGTTGLPKGVMLTHQNVLHGLSIYNYTYKNKANVLTITPWYHVYGLLTTMQYLVSGNLVVYLTEFIPEQYLAAIEKYQITEMPAVPTMLHVLTKSPLVKKYDLSSVMNVWCSAAPLSGDIINNAQKIFPNCKGMFQSYGMTETLAVLKEQENSFATRKAGSCGVPLPGYIAKVVDIETREKLGPNEQGELCFKGPSLMKGYVDNKEATIAIFDEEGFIKSGDIGYYDDNGCFYVVDRIKEIIKYKGQQVAPATVESVIMEHEAVVECGVVGAPDELAGELPTAFVVRKPGTKLTEQELLRFTTSKLSSMSRLRGGVIFVEEIPKNGSGKILRRELRNKLIEIKRLN